MTFDILPILFSFLLLLGTILVFVPFFPALSYMSLVVFTFGLIDGFSSLLPFELGILFLITLISIGVDWSSGVLGARYGGAHAKSIGWGILGMLFGTLIFPPFGGIVGLFIAIFIAERAIHEKTEDQSLKAAGGALLGTVVGMGINVFLALIFFLLFIWFVFF